MLLWQILRRHGVPLPERQAKVQIDGHSYRLDYAWADQDWRGISSIKGQILYELHVGTFTPEGTYAAAATIFI